MTPKTPKVKPAPVALSVLQLLNQTPAKEAKELAKDIKKLNRGER